MSTIVLCDFEWRDADDDSLCTSIDTYHKCMLEHGHPEEKHLCDCGEEQTK